MLRFIPSHFCADTHTHTHTRTHTQTHTRTRTYTQLADIAKGELKGLAKEVAEEAALCLQSLSCVLQSTSRDADLPLSGDRKCICTLVNWKERRAEVKVSAGAMRLAVHCSGRKTPPSQVSESSLCFGRVKSGVRELSVMW
jgi:hypothetical protein